MKIVKKILLKIGSFLLGIVGSALAVALVIALTPPLIGWLDELPFFQNEKIAYSESILLSRQLQESAKLVTTTVEEEREKPIDLAVPVLGEVRNDIIYYVYNASIGIDLRKVKMSVNMREITLTLPELEVITDGATITEIKRDDFLYPMTDEEIQEVLAEEIEECREHYLQENQESEEVWKNTLSAIDSTISKWITWDDPTVTVKLERPNTLSPES